jgi:hypothetical protein
MSRVIGYVRVSTERQGESGAGLTPRRDAGEGALARKSPGQTPEADCEQPPGHWPPSANPAARPSHRNESPNRFTLAARAWLSPSQA